MTSLTVECRDRGGGGGEGGECLLALAGFSAPAAGTGMTASQ